MADFSKIFFIPDTHIPFHDKKAYGIAVKAAQKFKPDTLVILGDFADFYSVSFHEKNPERKETLIEEIQAVKTELAYLSQHIKAKRKIFIAGNHEHRLERYLISKAPELFNMVRIPKLLELEKLGWEYVAYRDYVKLGKLLVTHDTGSAGLNAHRSSLKDAGGSSVLIGHTHRMAMQMEQTTEGQFVCGAMFGWLGDPAEIDYMHRTKTRNWTQGFGLGYMYKDGTVVMHPVPIVNGQAIVEGKIIK